MRKNIGLFTILFLSLLPVVRWFVISPPSFRFFDFNTTMTSFGQIAGLVGMALFSVNLILSSRLKVLDRFFYGLNNLYNIHHKIGAIAFSLLLFHPLFLVVKYIQISLKSAALFFIPFQDSATTFGIAALFLMVVLLGITFYAKIKYQNWKLSHKFMVAVFVFAVLHSFYISSDISRDNLLRFYILWLAIVGLSLGFYQAFLSKFFNNNFKYKINKVIMLNKDVVQIEAEPIAGVGMREFEAGQFVFVSFKSRGVSSEIHPFSISSAPNKNNFRLVIKSLGDFTGELKNLKTGDSISVEGPFGKFSYKNITNINQIWIAGGVGITPFLSMAGDLSDNGYKVDLYYCTRNSEEAVLADELTNLASVNKNSKLILWRSDERGFITGQAVSDVSGGLEGKDIMLCGPAPFIRSLKNQFLKLKVKKENIHLEEFKLL